MTFGRLGDLLEQEKTRIGTWGRLNPDRLEAVLKHSGKSVLDAGCSSGEYVRFLCRRGYHAYGFDILPSPEWEGPDRKRFVAGDIRALPFPDGSFDTVLLFEVLEHVGDVERALSEAARVTRSNIILSVPDATLHPVFRDAGLTFFHWVDRTHVNFFTPDGIAEALDRNGFDVEHRQKINPARPDILFFESLGFPPAWQKALFKITGNLPFRKRYFMSLLVTAGKRHR